MNDNLGPERVEIIKSINIMEGLRKRSQTEEKAYDSLGHFFEYVFNLKLASFHWEICEILMEAKKNPLGPHNPSCFLAPRDHAKTTIVAEAMPLWLAGRDQTEIIQIICSTTGLARKRLQKIESCIKYNKKYIQLFGDLYPHGNSDYTWNRDEMDVVRDRSSAWESGGEERDATFTAFGITTSVEGGRATYQAYDDIVTQENSRTEVGRAQLSEKVWMSFDPMLLPIGLSMYVGTTYHYMDFYCTELIPKFDTDKLYTDRYLDIIEQQMMDAAFIDKE